LKMGQVVKLHSCDYHFTGGLIASRWICGRQPCSMLRWDLVWGWGWGTRGLAGMHRVVPDVYTYIRHTYIYVCISTYIQQTPENTRISAYTAQRMYIRQYTRIYTHIWARARSGVIKNRFLPGFLHKNRVLRLVQGCFSRASGCTSNSCCEQLFRL
jgi:hypothetical protein